MVGTVVELRGILTDSNDKVGRHIGNLWSKWNDARAPKMEEYKELRNYIYATDTGTTSNADLPWKNSTTRPVLTRIRDSLHANYISTLFPNENWLRWFGSSEKDQDKAKVIEAYMKDKAQQSQLRQIVSQLLLDYIDFGMFFATARHVKENWTLPNGRIVTGYDGPKAIRISPLDIVFNPTAPSFAAAPKIIRSVKNIGELKALGETDENWQRAYEKTMNVRTNGSGFSVDDFQKAAGYSVDGFGDILEYYGSNLVEVLTFKGDYFDEDRGVLKKNQEMIVIDRGILVYSGENRSWLGNGDIVSAGWRERTDNLYAMGPLDNLVGMQYRIDHLENLKADAFDLMVHPILKIVGEVEPFTWGPGAHIEILGEGDVTELGANLQGVVTADNQIAILEQSMEEAAGNPKQAQGIRTPGEKTAFEVQSLDNASGRIFKEKTTNFEVNGLEPLLNLMLAEGRQNMSGRVSLRSINDQLGVEEFINLTPEDLVANGSIRPIGSRHFAEQSNLVQNLSQLSNTALGQMILPHWSSEKIAELIADSLQLDRFGVFRKNVALVEDAERTELSNNLGQIVNERSAATVEDENELPQ